MKNKISSSIDREKIIELIPELKPCVNCTQNHNNHIYDVFNHTIKTIEGLEKNFEIRLAALLHDIGKPKAKKIVNGVTRYRGHETVSYDMSRKILSRFDFEESLKEKVGNLVKFHTLKTNPSVDGLEQTINIIGYDLFIPHYKLKVADIMAHSEECIKKNIDSINRLKKIFNDVFLNNNPNLAYFPQLSSLSNRYLKSYIEKIDFYLGTIQSRFKDRINPSNISRVMEINDCKIVENILEECVSIGILHEKYFIHCPECELALKSCNKDELDSWINEINYCYGCEDEKIRITKEDVRKVYELL